MKKMLTVILRIFLLLTFHPRFREGMLFTILLFTFHVSLVKADWVQVNNGLNIWDVNALCSYTSGGVNYIFAGTLHGAPNTGVVFLSTNDGNNWSINLNVSNDVWSLATTNNGVVHYVFAGTGNGIGYTTNNGANWFAVGGPNPPGWTVSIAASGNYVFAGTYNYADTGGVYKSTNYGINWTRVTYFPPVPPGYKYYVGMNANYVYTSSTYERILYVSTDYGLTWIQSNLGSAASAFAFNANYVFANSGLNNVAVYRSSNNGFNWIPTSLDSVNVMTLLTYSSYVFAGGYQGVGFWESNDNGLTWAGRGVNEGLGGSPRALFISNGYIFAGTDGHGVFRRPLSELVGIKKNLRQLPQSYKIYQNFPNPFNPTTKIKFEIPAVGQRHAFDLRMVIYDVLGKEVATLLDQELRPGSYEITWDASNYPSGVYFYQLTADGSIINTRKMILLK